MLRYLREFILLRPEEPYDVQRKRIFVGVLLVPACSVALYFGLTDLWYGNRFDAATSLGFALFLLVMLVSIWQARQPDTWYRLSLFVFGGLLLLWLFEGGSNGEKALWLFIFPACALFALGYREGIRWNLVFYGLCLAIVIGDWPGRYPYPAPTVMRLLISLAMVMITSTIYERLRQQFQQRMLQEHQDLLDEQYRLQAANARIEHLAITDPLTGVYNRSILVERLTADLAATHAAQTPLAIILCDLDHFKLINDTYGHLVGDQVLQHITRILHDCVRQSGDWIVRYGGEEFLLVLPETDETAAVQVAERIRQMMTEQIIYHSLCPITVTASFGVVATSGAPPDADTITRLLHQADERLYQAKQAGRNRVVAAPAGKGADECRR